MSKQKRKPIGPARRSKAKAKCGVCGLSKQMTKAHVPPQCAGNEMLAKRHRLIVKGNVVSPGRQAMGGIFFRGLCAGCNTRASQYDGAYGNFAAALAQCWVKSLTLCVPTPITLPKTIDFDPGGVVRSILLGMCATGPLVNEHWPEFLAVLAEGKPVELPSEIKLYLALARGRSARVAGAIFGFHVIGPHARRSTEEPLIGINAIASVYFPPLAWELIHAGESILDKHGWVDVSKWTQLPPGEIHKLTDLVPSLPATCHPYHHPDLNDHWTEVLNSDLVDITECVNIEGGPPDPASPLTLTTRAHATIDEFREVGRRLGLTGPDT